MDGSGTAADPWIIINATDLQAMENNLASYYRIDRDINAIETAGWNGGAGFDPVRPFTGQLDGDGHTVSGLTIDRTEDIPFGLFGSINGATVLNLHLTNVDITAIAPDPPNDSIWTGALAGVCYGGSVVTDCSVEGGIASNSRFDLGGMFGQINASTVTRCWADVDLDIDATYAEFFKGGFVGSINADGVVSQCFALGDLDLNCLGQEYAGIGGGFVGYNAGDIDDCYALGDVTVTSGDEPSDVGYIGGFVGYNYPAGATIGNSYSIGSITASVQNVIGGFCGDNVGGAITDCFWDTTTSGEALSDGGTGKSTSLMKLVATFQAAGWAISRIWNVQGGCNNGYPCLIGVNACCRSSSGGDVDQTIVGDKVSLEAIRNLEIVYGGRFFIGKSGLATYESRYHRNV